MEPRPSGSNSELIDLNDSRFVYV